MKSTAFGNTILPHSDFVPSAPNLIRGYIVASSTSPKFKTGLTVCMPPTDDLAQLVLVYDQLALLLHLNERIVLVEFDPSDAIMIDHKAFCHTVKVIRAYESFNIPLVNRTIVRLLDLLTNELDSSERRYAQLSKLFNVLHGADKPLFFREATRFLRKIHR